MNQQITSGSTGYFSNQPPPIWQGMPQADLGSQTSPTCCILCGYKDNVSIQTYKRDYYPPAAFISIVLAPLVGVLVLLLFRVRYELPLPFCTGCWKRFRWAERFEALSLLGFFASLIFGVFLLLAFESLGLLIACPVAAIGVIVWAQIHKSRSGPKIKKIDRKKVVIAGSSYGDIVFSKTTTARIETGF